MSSRPVECVPVVNRSGPEGSSRSHGHVRSRGCGKESESRGAPSPAAVHRGRASCTSIYERKNFVAVSLLYFFNEVAERVLFVALPFFLMEKGFGAVEIGGIFSISSVALLLTRFFSGKLCREAGAKRVLILSNVIKSFSVALYPLCSSATHFSAARFFKEVGVAVGKVGRRACEYIAFSHRSRKKYLRKIGTVYPLSRAAGAVAGIVITSYFLAFLFSSLLFLLSAVLLLFLFHPLKEELLEEKEESKVCLTRVMLVAVLGQFLFLLTTIPAWFLLLNELGFTKEETFAMLLCYYLLATFLIHVFRKRIDSCDPLTAAGIIPLFFFFGEIFQALSFTKLQLFVATAISSLTYYFWRIPMYALFYSSLPLKKSYESIGVVALAEGISEITAPILGALVIEVLGLRSVFVIGAFLYLLIPVILLYGGDSKGLSGACKETFRR